MVIWYVSTCILRQGDKYCYTANRTMQMIFHVMEKFYYLLM